MKKNFFPYFLCVASLWVVLAVSCKKDNGSGFTSYIRGKIDSVSFECNANIKANTPEPIPGTGSGDDPNINITGEWLSYSIQLHLNGDGSSISAGSYTFQAGKNRSAKIWYNNTDSYYAGNGGLFDQLHLYGNGSIDITEISKHFVRGTFEFTTEINPRTGSAKTVTGGEFYIKRS